MKLFKQARKYGARIALAGSALMVGSMAHAAGTDPISTLLAGIDLTAVGAAVLAILAIVVTIAMSFKGADVSKRAIRKV